jgi:hypothetical protein
MFMLNSLSAADGEIWKDGKYDEDIKVGSAGANIEDTLPRPSRKEARVKTNKVCPTLRFLRFLAPVLTNRIGN